MAGLCPRCLARSALAGTEAESGAWLESAATPSPRIFGNYEVLEEIAHGGMGVVYKARQVNLKRPVALKTIITGRFASSTDVQRFRAEAEAAAKLDHPNIVPIYEIGDHEGQLYFSMPFLEGGTLTERLRLERFAPRAAATFMAVVARAVHHAHQRGILHRDLKPGNILLDGNGQPHVTDFGLAQRIEREASLTVSGAVVGTPNYLSPEQAGGSRHQLTTASDVFSLGTILYELLTGEPPFKADCTITVLRQVAEKIPENPRLKNPAIDRDLAAVCLKALEKKAEDRYHSAELFAEDLERWFDGRPTLAKPPTLVVRMAKWARREPATAALSAVSLAALGVLIAFVVLQFAFRAERQQRRETEAALKEANRQSAEAGRQRARAEELQRLRMEDAELRLASSHLNAWFNAGEENYALAYLADLARRFPSNLLVAERVLGELGSRQFPRRIFGPRKNAKPMPRNGDLVALPTETRSALQFLDLPSGEIQQTFEPRSGASNIFIRNFFFDKSGDFVLIEDAAGYQQVWNVSTGLPQGKPLSPNSNRRIIGLLSRGERILHLSGGSWYLRDATSGDALSSGTTGPNVQMSPDERYFTSTPHASTPGVVNLYQLGGVEASLAGSVTIAALDQLAFSPKGDLLVISTLREIQVFKLPHLEVVSTFQLSDGPFRLMRITPDAERIVGVAGNNQLQSWTIKGQKLYAAEDHSRISDIQFSADSAFCVTAGLNGIVRVLETGTLKPVSEGISHGLPVNRAWFSKDGAHLYSTIAEDTLYVWDANALPPAQQQGGRPTAKNLVTRDAGGGGDSLRIDLAEPVGYKKLWGDETVPLPVPGWVPEFLEMLAGVKLDSQGAEFVTQAQLRTRLRDLEAAARPDLYERFARWSLTDSNLRPALPIPLENENLETLVAENTPESLREAFWMKPGEMLTLARIARRMFERAPDSSERYVRAAVARTPADPQIWRIYLEVLRIRGERKEALAKASEATERFPLDSALRESYAAQLEAAGRYKEALAAFEAAHALAVRAKSSPSDSSARLAIIRERILRAINPLPANKVKTIASSAARDDSPSWGSTDLGRNMYSTAKGLPESFEIGAIKWDQDFNLGLSRNVHWAARLGSQSYGAPVIANGKIFVGTNNDHPRDRQHQGDRSILMCLDERDGEFIWQLVVPKLRSGKVNDWENLGLISTPSVVGNRLYIVTSRAELLCLDVNGMENGNDGPFVDEAKYVTDGMTNSLSSPGIQDADIIWRFDMIEELGAFPHNASASSPLILGESVFVGTGNGMDWTHSNIPSPRSPMLVAVDRHTGKLLAEDDAEVGNHILHGSWSSPSSGKVNGRDLVFFGGPDGFCYAFDSEPVTGEEGVQQLKTMWKVDCNPPEYRTRAGRPVRYPSAEGHSEIIATPVFYRSRLYVAIGQDPEHGEGVGNLLCLDPDPRALDRIIWQNKTVQRSVSTVSIDPDSDLLFVTDFSGFLHCIDITNGKTWWKHDLRAHVWPGGTMVADGKVFIGDEDGDFLVLAAAKEKRVLSEVNLGVPTYSTPVAANGALYIKSHTHLFAIRDLRLQLN